MTFVSYAQNFEDVMLWRALKHISPGFYIDVGAAWPDEHSVTKAFYDRGWRGINIEPNPRLFQELQRYRERDVNLSIALHDHMGTSRMNIVCDTGLSTLREPIAAQHREAGFDIEALDVHMTTLSEVWKEHVADRQDVHFLKIDVEGLEAEVLRGNDWTRNRPWIVVVEATLPKSQMESYEQWEPVLLGADYRFVYADGLNRFYVAVEHADLASAFKYPPNVFDDFVPQVQQAWKERAASAVVQARQAEREARQAEARIHAAESEMREVAERALRAERLRHDAENALAAVYSSRSWRATRLLRWTSGRLYRLSNEASVFAKYTLRNAARRIGGLPLIHGAARAILQRHPRLELRVHRVLAREPVDAEFTVIPLGDIEVHFCNGPLVDRRGIGRVSRELLAQFQALSKELAREDSTREVHRMYFYGSIHWCPDRLPQPSIVLIHDVIPLLFPEEFPPVVLYEWNARLREIARQARRIVTVSRSSASDISRVLEIPAERVTVIYNGVTPMQPREVAAISLPVRPYLVFLGSYDRHKNVDVVLQAMTSAKTRDIELVMIGENSDCSKRVAELGLERRVHFLGRLSDEQAGYVIKNAVALAFPSLYEGFGLPPLEAALVGTPSICSKRPAMTELLEDAALFAEPDSPHEWAAAITMLANDAHTRARLGDVAKQRIEAYTWARAAKRYADLFKALAPDRHPGMSNQPVPQAPEA